MATGVCSWARSRRWSRLAVVVETRFVSLFLRSRHFVPTVVAFTGPAVGCCSGISWTWQKAQLFLEGEQRGAWLLLISQKTFSWSNPPLALRCVEPQGGKQ